MPNRDFYFAGRARKLSCYGDVIHSFYWKSAVEHDAKCVIVYLAQDVPPFVMYCVYGESGSSLLTESGYIVGINYFFVCCV